MKATFGNGPPLMVMERQNLQSAELQETPTGKVTGDPTSTKLMNKDMLHSMNEQSMGTANLRGEMQT